MKWAKNEVSATLSCTEYRHFFKLRKIEKTYARINLNHRIYSKELICADIRNILSTYSYSQATTRQEYKITKSQNLSFPFIELVQNIIPIFDFFLCNKSAHY